MPDPRAEARARRARKQQIGMLSLAALFFASALLLALVCAINGSLELFPTPEQQGKTRIIAALTGLGLAIAEAATLILLRRLCALTPHASRIPARFASRTDASDHSMPTDTWHAPRPDVGWRQPPEDRDDHDMDGRPRAGR